MRRLTLGGGKNMVLTNSKTNLMPLVLLLIIFFDKNSILRI